MSHVTTHILDTALGRPARGVPVRLESTAGDAPWEGVAEGRTDGDGRVADLGPDRLPTGRYRIVFDTAAYFAATGQRGLYPEVAVVFELAEAEEHYHVPLLLSPFSYSTYRGS
ncbi:hydroxyisourate hydrolase [Nocardiopsis sp. CNT312]|uniref:hydroxyisourate hydrolase n=1 Tax=Nocardiopsis sp. CNT312 TaxID=1137268 RepID=UPI00048AE96D|nr:hydroxyisourate hydrolase [Nocardiopsis sp. CNT312]